MRDKWQILFIFILLINLGYLSVSGLSNLYTVSASSPYQAGSTSSRLTYSQVKELVQGGHPDRFIAREIRERGIDFRLDENKERELRRLGAGSETLDVLKKANRQR